MDVLDANAEDVRFLQATRHGEVLTPVELIEGHAPRSAGTAAGVARIALRRRHAARHGAGAGRGSGRTRQELLGHYVSEELADSLDRHYALDLAGDDEGAMRAEQWVDDTLAASAQLRRRAQFIGALALVPFVVHARSIHGVYHEVPLFLASFAGFAVAIVGIARIPRMRALALREAATGIRRVLLSLPAVPVDHAADAGRLLRSHGEPDSPRPADARATTRWRGRSSSGSTVLSAILDNNVVADFASRALREPGSADAAPVRDVADRRICAGRMLDAHRMRAVGGRLRVHPARRRRALHAVQWMRR